MRNCEILVIIPFDGQQNELAHLVEHLLIMNVKNYLQNIMEIGAEFSASTYIDRIVFSLSCEPQWTDLAMRNVMSLFRLFKVNDEDVSREIQIIKEERHQNIARSTLLSELQSKIMGRFMRLKNVKHVFNRADVMAFYDKYAVNKIVILNTKTLEYHKANNNFQNNIKKNVYLPNLRQSNGCAQYYFGVMLFPHGHKNKPFVDLLIYAYFSSYNSIMIRYLRFAYGLTYSIKTHYTTTGVLIVGFSSLSRKDIKLFDYLKKSRPSQEEWQKYVVGYCRHVHHWHKSNQQRQTMFYGLNKLYDSSYGFTFTDYLSYIKKHDSYKICHHIMQSILNSPKVMTF